MDTIIYRLWAFLEYLEKIQLKIHKEKKNKFVITVILSNFLNKSIQ